MTDWLEARAGNWTRRAPIPSVFAIALGASALVFAAVALVLLMAPVGTRSIALPVFVIGATVVFGVGLSDLARADEPRFALALIGAGLLWSLSALSASADSTLYTVGRLNLWFAHLAIIYLLLSYPSGRLTDRTSRKLFAGAVLILGLYLPSALLTRQLPDPSLWSVCRSDCPANAIALGHSTPALVQDLLVPLRETLTLVLFAAVALVVAMRRRLAEPLLGHMYAPIAYIAQFEAIGLALYYPIRAVAPGSWTLRALGWIVLLALPAVAVACGTGRLYRRVHTANALDRIARAVRSGDTAAQVRRALARAFEDPSLQILHSFPGDSGSWVDESGSPVAPPQDAPEQRITMVGGGSWRIAILHNSSLSEDPSVVETAGSYALSALENGHLTEQLRVSLQELAQSHARGIAAEDRERRKIERDLHDGAQQRLVALRVKLGLAAGQLDDHDPAAAAAIRALGPDIDATIDDVRSFARGVYPALLAETGLREALRAISRTAALPTTVHAEGLDRYPPEVEMTVYFSCSEALQNAAKHATGATGVTISVWQDRELRFEICDDGAGFDPRATPAGTGLSNLRERLAAANGTLKIRSGPEQGTRVTGSIPVS